MKNLPPSITIVCCCCFEQIFMLLQCLVCDAQGQVTTEPWCGAHRRGRTELSLVTKPHPWQGLAAAAWRKWPRIRSSHACWKEPDLPGPHHGVHSSRHWLLMHGGAGVWDDTLECLRNPPFRNTPVQRAWQMKGRWAHGAFPSQVPWSMMQAVADMDGATWLYNHLCGSEQSYIGWHAADIVKQPDQSILVKLLHANTNTLNGN